MKMERRTVALTDCEVRATDGGDGMHFSGLAAVFNSPTMIGNQFREQVAPGAFDNAIQTDDVRLLLNHNPDLLLGRTGRNVTLTTTERGLKVDADLPNTQLGRDTAELVRSGILTQMSFGFATEKGGDSWAKGADGIAERTLTNVRLFDVSPVTYPAYNDTTAEVRAHAAATREGRGLVWNSEDGMEDYEDDIEASLPQGFDGTDNAYGYVCDVKVDGSAALVAWYDNGECTMYIVPVSLEAGEPVAAPQDQWVAVVPAYIEDAAEAAEGDEVMEANSLKIAARIEKRAGKVLSDENMGHLTAAMERLQALMANATAGENDSSTQTAPATDGGAEYNSAREIESDRDLGLIELLERGAL